MDEADYYVLEQMLSRPGNLKDGALTDSVSKAIAKGYLEVDKENNDDKRVTFFGLDTEFRNGRIPAEIGKLDALKDISLECEDLTSLPGEICILQNLERLFLEGCFNLMSLPDGISRLRKLKVLSLDGCYSLLSLPETIGQLCALEHLDLDGCSKLTTIPDSIGMLSNLKHLSVSPCGRLSELPATIGKLISLEVLCINVAALKGIPESIGTLSNLRDLYAFDIPYDANIDEFIQRPLDVLPTSTIYQSINLCNLQLLGVSLQDLIYFEENSFASSKKLKELTLRWNEVRQFDTATPINFPILPFLEKLTVDVIDNSTRFQGHWLSLLPKLRECTINCEHRMTIPSYELRNLRKLEKLTLSGCDLATTTSSSSTENLIQIDFISLRELIIGDCSGRINFLEFDLSSLEILEVTQSDELFFEKDAGQSEESLDERCFHICELGHCPHLNKLIVHQSKYATPINIKITYESLVLFPVIQDVSFSHCKIYLFEDMPTPLQQRQHEQTISLLSLKMICFDGCEGFLESDFDSFQNLKFDLSSLEIFCYKNDLQMDNDRLEKILRELLPCCPNVGLLDFQGCGITQIPSKTILEIPPKLIKMNLSRNPIFQCTSGRNSLCDLLHRCKYLYHLGFFGGDDQDSSRLHRTKLGHIMSLNRSRSKVLMGQITIPALWSTILQNAPNVFRKDIEDDFIGIKEKADAVYHLLRERAAEGFISFRNHN